jgi:hypothetical protein
MRTKRNVCSLYRHDFKQAKTNDLDSILSGLHIGNKDDHDLNTNVCYLEEMTNTSAHVMTVDVDPDLLNLRVKIEKCQQTIDVFNDNVKKLSNKMIKLRRQMMLLNKELSNILIQREEAQSVLAELNELYRSELK